MFAHLEVALLYCSFIVTVETLFYFHAVRVCNVLTCALMCVES